MNWITNYVRPRINSIFSRREVPENLWSKCDNCGTMLFHRELKDNLNVCTNCDHHMAITPRDRFHALFDGGIFTEVEVPEPVADPLTFKDQKKYPDRMKAAQKKTGEKDALIAMKGQLKGMPIVAIAFEFDFELLQFLTLRRRNEVYKLSGVNGNINFLEEIINEVKEKGLF